MAKKHRLRTWYAAFFKKEADQIFLNRLLPDHLVMFDSEDMAYTYKMNQRLMPLKDENGEAIVDENGYAQLPDHGKITVVGIKGSKMDWKQIEKAPKEALRQMDIQADAINVHYRIATNKQNLKVVLEETDDIYNRFANSPMAKAGGVTPIPVDETIDQEEAIRVQEKAVELVKEMDKVDGDSSTETLSPAAQS